MAYRQRGMAWGHRAEHDKAIADLTLAIQLAPRDAESYFRRGISSQEKGEFAKARADYNEGGWSRPRLYARRLRQKRWPYRPRSSKKGPPRIRSSSSGEVLKNKRHLFQR